jgi:hypothetical protein
MLSKRSDISVWFKGRQGIRAAIEIKKAYNAIPILHDTKKLDKIVGLKQGPQSGYLVAYSEAKPRNGKDTLSQRFADWENQTGWKQVSAHVDPIKDDNNWVWGFCILRSQKG